jgi:hypothetical protein
VSCVLRLVVAPGDAEDDETGEGDEAGSSEGEISDTNAPYAEAEAQPAGRSRRGEQQLTLALGGLGDSLTLVLQQQSS